MAVGRVVKFDQARGFGFIAPAGGGEDVFLHVNDLLMPEAEVRPGIAVEFDVDEGGRGLKGSNIRLAEGDGAAGSGLSWRHVSGPSALRSLAPATAAPVTEPVREAASAAPEPLVAAAAQRAGREIEAAAGDDDLCDVLTTGEFSLQVTELLLTGVPELTGAQVLEVRRLLLDFSRARGWVSA